MPTIETRKNKQQKVIGYRVKVRVKGYPPETASFERKTDAKEWGQRIEAEMRADKYFSNAKAKKHTVSDLIDKYLANLKGVNPRRHGEVTPLLDWWKKEIGHRLLSGVSTADIVDGQQKLMARPKLSHNQTVSTTTISPATVNRYRVALHTAFGYGVKTVKWIHANPADGIKKLEEPLGRVRYLTGDEMTALLDACKTSNHPYLFALVMVGLGTGARRAEIETIRWTQVNADCTTVVLLKTKNKTVRTLHLTGKVSEMVRMMRENKNPDDYYVFQALDGSGKPAIFQSAWGTALKRAKIEDFRFHDLRHTHASYLAMGGASTLEIAEALGHKNLEMVKRYAHLSPSHTASVIGKTTEGMFSNVEI
jgi:integrase